MDTSLHSLAIEKGNRRINGMDEQDFLDRMWYEHALRTGIRLQIFGVKLEGAPEWKYDGEGIRAHNEAVAGKLGVNADAHNPSGKKDFGFPAFYREANVSLADFIGQLGEAGFILTNVHVRRKTTKSGGSMWVTTVGFYLQGKEAELQPETVAHLRRLFNEGVFASTEAWLNPQLPQGFDATRANPWEQIEARVDNINLRDLRDPAKLEGVQTRKLTLTPNAYGLK